MSIGTTLQHRRSTSRHYTNFIAFLAAVFVFVEAKGGGVIYFVLLIFTR